MLSAGHDKQELGDYIYFHSESNLGISYTSDGQTPLHVAASYSHASIVEILCRNFPQTINRADREGCTPLHLAARANPGNKQPWPLKSTNRSPEDTAAVETLLRYGADTNARDREGNTCLHYATAWGNLKIVRILVSAGMNPQSNNYSGSTPESYSQTVQAEVYYRNLVGEFERRGAEPVQPTRDRGLMRGGGAVRLVASDEEDNDIDTASQDSRSRADSVGSRETASSEELSNASVGRAF